MALNRKLTPLIAGRTIQTATHENGVLVLVFADGSTLHVKTGGPAPASDALTGRTVQTVKQTGTLMDMSFTDNSTGRIKLAEATSSVLLRGANGSFEYAD